MTGPVYGVTQMTEGRLDALVRLVGRIAPTFQPSILEIGSYEGRSALAMSHAIGARDSGRGSVLCIDPWLPYFSGEPTMKENVMQMEQDLSTGEAFARFRANIKYCHPNAPITYLKATLPEVMAEESANYLQRQFDLVFVDGCHRYTEVSQDIAIARKLVYFGGILAGDDLEKQGQKIYDAVKHNREQDMFKGCHPGVTCAVWENFGEVFCDAGIWAVRKTYNGWENLK